MTEETKAPLAVPASMTELRKAARAARPEGLIDLSRSEPLPIPVPDACMARVSEGFGRARLYSPSGGLTHARTAAARYARGRTGLDIGNDQVTITPGAMAGISIALRGLTEPGDEVLVPVPYFHSHPRQVEMLGAEPRFVDTRPAQGVLTPEAVERELSPRTRALLLCNPSNPGGVALTREQLAAIVAVLPPRVALIGDEVYAEYVYDGAFTSLLQVLAEDDADREVVVLSTASKTAGMPGWRVGSAISSPGLADKLAAAAATLTGPASVPTQIAYAAWLDDPPELDRMAPYRPRLRDTLAALHAAGLSVRPPDGTYYVWATGATDRATDRPADRPADGATETVTDRAADRASDRPADGAADRPDEGAADGTEDTPPTAPATAPTGTAGTDSGSNGAPSAGSGIGSTDRVLSTAEATGVLVWPGVLFGDAESVRISLSVPRGDLRDGVTKLTDSWREVREGDVPISRSRR